MFAPNSYVKRSGQSWKVWLSMFLELAGFVLFLIAFNTKVKDQPDAFVSLMLGGMSLGLIGFIGSLIFIQCKNCKTRLAWRAMRKESHDNWLIWLFRNERCPVCNDDGIYNTELSRK